MLYEEYMYEIVCSQKSQFSFKTTLRTILLLLVSRMYLSHRRRLDFLHFTYLGPLLSEPLGILYETTINNSSVVTDDAEFESVRIHFGYEQLNVTHHYTYTKVWKDHDYREKRELAFNRCIEEMSEEE